MFDGDLDRLMIFMPPRHGKSELVTKHFTAYFLKHNPEKKVIIGCYNQNLANKFSRGIKNIHLQDKFLEAEARGEKEPVFETTEASEGVATTVRSRITDAAGCMLSSNSQLSTVNYQLAFRPRNAEAEWETPEGGGVRAVGVGAGITGYGANLIIIDDPVRSRADANSANYREKVWDWFNDDVTTRLEPDGKIILIQTRWHEDDLAGRLLKQMNEEGGEHWEVIDLPALATPPKKDKSDKSKEMNYEPNNIQPKNQVYYILNGRQVPVHTLGQPKETTAVLSSSLKGTRTLAQGKDEVRHPGYPAKFDPDPEGVAQTTDEWRDELGRREGQALWPERFPEQKLEKIKHQIGSYSFAALYQQTPVPAEGGLFKRAWFKTVPYLPPNLKKKRGWDLKESRCRLHRFGRCRL